MFGHVYPVRCLEDDPDDCGGFARFVCTDISDAPPYYRELAGIPEDGRVSPYWHFVGRVGGPCSGGAVPR
jgi:hypothetical protein